MPAPEVLPRHRARAVNVNRASTNAVHDDDSAAALGFDRGLVPGVVIYEYLCRPAVSRWGCDWFRRGTMSVELRRPVYDGQTVVIESSPIEHTTDGEEAELSAVANGSQVVATATAALFHEPLAVPRRRYVQVPLSQLEHRPIAGSVAFAALDQLGSIERRFSLNESIRYLSQLGGDPGAYRTLGVASPSDLLRDANAILASNVEIGPWLHVATDATHYSPLLDGEMVSTRGSVVDVYERNENHYAVLDLLVVANGSRPVMHLHHTVIWRLGAMSNVLAIGEV